MRTGDKRIELIAGRFYLLPVLLRQEGVVARHCGWDGQRRQMEIVVDFSMLSLNSRLNVSQTHDLLATQRLNSGSCYFCDFTRQQQVANLGLRKRERLCALIRRSLVVQVELAVVVAFVGAILPAMVRFVFVTTVPDWLEAYCACW